MVKNEIKPDKSKTIQFFQLLCLSIYYYYNDKNLAVAIPPLIVATLIALVVVWFLEKKIKRK